MLVTMGLLGTLLYGVALLARFRGNDGRPMLLVAVLGAALFLTAMTSSLAAHFDLN